MQKHNLYLNQFSNQKGAIGKPERPKRYPIWVAHPRTHLSTKYPPPGLKHFVHRNTLQINISYLIIYRNLHYRQKNSFGDILRKFDGNWTYVIDSVCLLNTTPKSVYLMLYLLCRRQNASFVTLNPVVNIM